MRFTKNSIWTTMDGREIRFKDLNDDHINNIIHHLRQRGETCMSLFDALFKVAASRKMDLKTLGDVQLPYSDYDPFVLRSCIKKAISKGKVRM